MDLATENKNLNNEIDQCLLSILEYERINKDLQKEVENYIACDEEARSLLNRKEAMRTLLQQVSTKLHKTEEQIAHLRWFHAQYSFNSSLNYVFLIFFSEFYSENKKKILNSIW